MSLTIESVCAWEDFDARGWPTLTAEVRLTGGALGRAIAPGSVAEHHYGAPQLRDDDYTRHRGRGVRQAIAQVNGALDRRLRGRDAGDQAAVDAAIAATDAPPFLGANASLAVSLALARAAATAGGQPLWSRLGTASPGAAPAVVVDLLSGGQRSTPGLDFRSYLVVLAPGLPPQQAIEQGFALAHGLRDWLLRSKLPLVRTEHGTFAPAVAGTPAALDLLLKAAERAGLTPNQEVSLGIDVGARHLFDVDDERYFLGSQGRALDSDTFLTSLEELVSAYPISLLVDPLSPADAPAAEGLQARFGAVQVVGYEFFAGSAERVALGVKDGAAGGAALDLSQMATLTGALEFAGAVRRAGWALLAQAAPGETADTALADIAVAAGATAARFGPLAGAEHLVKYTRLAQIARKTG